MTRPLTEAQFDRICAKCLKIARDKAPNPDTRYITSTGNLAFNAIRIKILDRANMRFEIYVDANIAPYAKYPNEKEYWANGAPYEFYRFWQDTSAVIAAYVSHTLHGKLIQF